MYQGKYVSNNASPKKKKPAPPKEKPQHSRTGTIVFYSIYSLLVVAFVAGIIAAMVWVKDWLVEFEASQPDNASQRVFEANFSSPDWNRLYEMAARQDGYAFDSVEDYAAFMSEQLEDASISMIETSAGLSGGKKYIVRAQRSDGTTMDFATFTLADLAGEGAVIPDWQLSEVVLRIDPKLMPSIPADVTYGYTFLISTGNTVTVNGTVLDDNHIQRTVTTKAEEYLPEGVSGYRLTELYIGGLEAQPQVVLTDPSGAEIPMIFDAATNTYTQDLTPSGSADTEHSAVLEAATTYCKYMIRATGKDSLKKWFDSGKTVYANITGTNSWMQDYSSYSFSDEQTVRDYYRYSDSLFSARVTLTLNVKRSNGTVKPYELDTTFFMEKQGDNWKVIEMTNINVQEQVTQVRMTYLHTNGTLIRSEMLDAGVNSLTPPTLEVPEGKTFRGWATKTIGDNGKNVFTVIYLPNSDGNVILPTQNTLEPTTLYAIFGEAE